MSNTCIERQETNQWVRVGKTRKESSTCPTTQVPISVAKKPENFRIGKIYFYGEETQILMNFVVILKDGSQKALKILIDTGAQANLIKRDLIPESVLTPAISPLTLVAANGTMLGGGTSVGELLLSFKQVQEEVLLPDKVQYKVEFYVADIHLDAILGFPWLKANGLGFFPHYRALAREHPSQVLLYGISPKDFRRVSRPAKTQTCEIDTTPGLIPKLSKREKKREKGN